MTSPSVDLNPLLAASAAGQLQLTEKSAADCANACQRYIDELDALYSGLTDSAGRGGFGTLGSGDALGKKFSELLVGGGDFLSLKDVVRQHIDVATRLKAVFLKAGADYARTEHENTQMIVEAGG